LATALEVTPRRVEIYLEELEEIYADRGIRVQRHRDRIQLTTAPETAPVVERFLSLEATTRLSRAALEALAIIAYQQPVTRPMVDSIRGVNSDGVIRNLLSKGLLEEAGRSESPGRPILYQTTPEFLQHFGLASLEELPPLAPDELPDTDEKQANSDNTEQLQLLKD
jgi:segregation and condensation protein B